ncbi:unnamed protein product [Parnassius apollo]|uniref:(apollo) hypothetical protein n=1 Tax=Parnassius apollo TaxID=110799 RepID=A0A8S3WD98_PARAO|nr:unnamed protein product [Parnassius apollo]
MIIIFLAIMFYSGLQSTIIRAKIKGGITKAMIRYASHLPSKVAIDRLQTRFHCCGRVDYQEWFYIPWFNTGESVPNDAVSNSKFVADNVPYSCCSKDALSPCIHHGVTQIGLIYKYDPTASQVATNEKIDVLVANIEVLNTKSDNKSIAIDLSCNEIFSELQERYLREKKLIIVGVPEAKGETSKQRSASDMGEVLKIIKITFPECPDPIQVRRIGKYSPKKIRPLKKQLTIWSEGCEEKLINEMMSVSWRFNAVMSLMIIKMIIQVIAVRYLHTAYKNGLHCGNQITCYAYLLRSATDTKLQQTGTTKRKSFRKKKIKQARTLQWVTGSSRTGLRKCSSSSASDINSSDELLKPVFE